MTTSSSKDFELDVADYVEEAFERCGLEVRTGYDLKTARRSLNILFADWANRGLNRWTISQSTLSLANGVSEYPLGTLTLPVASSSGFSVGEIITGSSSSATATITSLASSTSLAITIPSGTFTSSETITGGTSSNTSTSSGVVSFADVISSIDILSAVIRQNDGISTQADTSITRVSRDTFLSISNKRTTSTPSQFYVDRQIIPVIKLWPTPNSSSLKLVFDRLTRIQDADADVNTVDVPFRFYPCLTAGLAYYIAMKKTPDRVKLLKAVYEEEFERAAAEDRDRSSLSLTPSSTYYQLI